MKHVFQNGKLKEQRKANRNNPTEAESYLWKHLRKRQLGYKFQRQYSVGTFILDFYCSKVRLGIEIDGGYHLNPEQKEYDEYKEIQMKEVDINVLRFKNEEVMNSIEKVIEKINQFLYSFPTPPFVVRGGKRTK